MASAGCSPRPLVGRGLAAILLVRHQLVLHIESSTGPAISPQSDGPAPAVRSRRRRIARRLLLWLAVAFAAVTTASLVFNAVTGGPVPRPAGLKLVRAGGVLTRYLSWGTAGTPVILVPGAFETADTFARLGPRLGTDHRVFALDLTGTGYSQATPPFTVSHFAAQLLGFVEAMGLTGKNAPVLVGHSSGAAVAGLAAIEGGRRIAGVMFLDGDAEPLGAPSFLRYLVIEPYRTTLFRLGLSSDTVIRAIYDSQCGPRCPALTHAGFEVWRRPLQQPGSEGALWSMLRTGIPSLTAAQFARLRASPAAKSVVFGADDPQYGKSVPAQVAARIGAPAPIIVPGRHLTMIASPGQVAAAIRALCRRAATAPR
jgi:pimeloyl-ACP methyl ester carboxylesterase